MNNTMIERYQAAAEIPKEMRTISLDEVTPLTETQARLVELLKSLAKREYKTLTICGNVGTGKTYLSRAWLNKVLDDLYKVDREDEWAVKYVTHYELDLRFKSAMTDRSTSQSDVYNRYSKYKHLVIDEFCRGVTSDYSMNFIENLLGRRYDWNYPTVIITNKTVKELRSLLDAQMLDRLGAKGQKTFALDGESLR